MGNPQDQRIKRRHMDMPLRDDNPGRQLQFGKGADQADARRPLQVAGHSQRRGNPQRSGVGTRNFHLAYRAQRAEQAHIFELPFRSHQSDGLLRGVLSRLQQRFFLADGMAGKQPLIILCGQVDMTV